MLTFKSALSHMGIKATVTDSIDGVRVQLETASDLKMVSELATSVYGMVIDKEGVVGETASATTLVLVEQASPRYVQILETAAAEDEEGDDDGEADDLFEEEDEGGAEGEEGDEAPAEDEEPNEDDDEDAGAELPGGGDDLKVLTEGEHHKIAAKLYAGLCNNSDMSKYPRFLLGFDRFLGEFYVKPKGGNLEGEEDHGAEFASLLTKECSCGKGELACTCEGADFEPSPEDLREVARFALELAKKKKGKKGRAGFLSVMMKHIAGDAGEALVRAWESGDQETVISGLGAIGRKIAETMPDAEQTEKTDKRAEDDTDHEMR